MNIEALHAYCVSALVTTGMSESNSRTVADKLVLTDSWGTFTHGNKLLGDYIKRLDAGGTEPLGQAQVVNEGPAWAIVDGGNAKGQIGCDLAMRKAIELAAKPAYPTSACATPATSGRLVSILRWRQKRI